MDLTLLYSLLPTSQELRNAQTEEWAQKSHEEEGKMPSPIWHADLEKDCAVQFIWFNSLACDKQVAGEQRSWELCEQRGVRTSPTLIMGISISDPTSTLINRPNLLIKISHCKQKINIYNTTSLHLVLKAISILLLVSGTQHFFMTGK